MCYTFVSPGKYIQGPGLLEDLAKHSRTLGNRPYIVISRGGKERFEKLIRQSFRSLDPDSDIQTDTSFCEIQVFHGECTRDEVRRLSSLACDLNCDHVIGIGGGKVMDTAKLVAMELSLPVMICPTIAATDAPTAGRAILYSPEGVFIKGVELPRNPDIVLVDSAVIAKAPVRLLVSGMGDALATFFETGACLASGSKNPAGGYTTVAAAALAKSCFDTLLEYGAQAKTDAETGQATLAVNRIIEVNTLLSGLGFESGGLASAHAINKGLTHIKECDAFYHGEKVAYGTLCQLIMEEQNPDLIQKIFTFCKSVGLPTTLNEIGLARDQKEKLRLVAQVAASPDGHTKNEPMKVTEQMVYNAMLKVDAIGTKGLSGKKESYEI